jgi:hypothetical protein
VVDPIKAAEDEDDTAGDPPHECRVSALPRSLRAADLGDLGSLKFCDPVVHEGSV